jgi:flagellum-specific ATP synthase
MIDQAIALNPALEDFLRQDKDDATPLAESFARLEAILAGADA